MFGPMESWLRCGRRTEADAARANGVLEAAWWCDAARVTEAARLSVLISCVASLIAASEALADEPGTRLEMETLVAASDVSTPESLAADPWGRWVEARFRVTLLNSPASGREVVELVTQLESPARTAQVVDYSPRTTMSTDVAGSVHAQRRDHSSRWLDFQLHGFAPWLAAGPARGTIRGAADAASLTETRWEQLPPREWRVASGVSNGGFGAYFKLRGDARSTLEGGHELTLTMRVPRAWRGDWLSVRCDAYAREPSLVPGSETRRRVASQRFLVVVYAAQDPGAREAAVAVLRTEQRLRRALAERPAELKLADSLVTGPLPHPATLANLPARVREAAMAHRAAREQLRSAPRVSPVMLDRVTSDRLGFEALRGLPGEL